ncbi:hypothetical protein GBF38_014594 [Nibea albiflora]|uniref:Uncharacterized protein n=1 Tax=Nibea albiflora TaxID=240163 RepID=A0ACB7F779_NIBAL|nr:hypothetical protein GBF38_014594 [Nibea albiflora]
MSCKASNMQRIMQVVHRVAQKSCRMVCQMLCCPLDNLLCEKVACCPDQATCSCSHGQQGAAPASLPPLATAEPPNINIDSSHLNCVIIGDNNYMHAEQIHSNETDEPQV